MAPASPLAPCRRARREKKEATLKLGPQRTELTKQQCRPRSCAGHERYETSPADRQRVAALTFRRRARSARASRPPGAVEVAEARRYISLLLVLKTAASDADDVGSRAV